MNSDTVLGPAKATIESVVTDQGNGSSWCSRCKGKIDFQKLGLVWFCPTCHATLTLGETGGDYGGSDF